jgi:hypothetical protein
MSAYTSINRNQAYSQQVFVPYDKNSEFSALSKSNSALKGVSSFPSTKTSSRVSGTVTSQKASVVSRPIPKIARTKLLKVIADIDSNLIEGKTLAPEKMNEINAILHKYQLKLPSNTRTPLSGAAQHDAIHRIDLLKKVHVLAFEELGFWSEDRIWQTRKPLAKNCSERNTYSKHQYDVAKSILDGLSTTQTPPLATLRSAVMRASLNGLVKRAPFSILSASQGELQQEIESLKTSLDNFIQINKPHQCLLSFQQMSPRHKISGIFSSTRNSSKTGALKELAKFASEVKTIPPKTLLSAGNDGVGTVALQPGISTNGLSQLGMASGAVGLVEDVAGFFENVKKLRHQKKCTYFDTHMKTYYSDNIRQYNQQEKTHGYREKTFDRFYSQTKLDEANKSLDKRKKSKTIKIDIYGNLLRYPCAAVRDTMATVVFGMRFAGKVSIPLAQSVSVVTAPISLLAMGLSSIQVAKSSRRVQKIKAFQKNLETSFTKLQNSKHVSKQTLKTFEAMVNNAKRGEPRATRLKFYKDAFSAFSYATSAGISTWAAVGLFAGAVAGPPGWVVTGAIATAAASGAVGYGMYHAIKKIRTNPNQKIEGLRQIKQVIIRLHKHDELRDKDIKILNDNQFILKRLGASNKTLTGSTEDIKFFKDRAFIEKLKAYETKYNASSAVLQTIDLIRKKDCPQDVMNYLKNGGIIDEVIYYIKTEPVTVLNIRRQAELVTNAMKINVDMPLSDCVRYVSKVRKAHSLNTH